MDSGKEAVKFRARRSLTWNVGLSWRLHTSLHNTGVSDWLNCEFGKHSNTFHCNRRVRPEFITADLGKCCSDTGEDIAWIWQHSITVSVHTNNMTFDFEGEFDTFTSLFVFVFTFSSLSFIILNCEQYNCNLFQGQNDNHGRNRIHKSFAFKV